MIYGNFSAKIINQVRAGFKESNRPRASNGVNPYHSSVSEDKGRSSCHRLARVLDVTEGDDRSCDLGSWQTMPGLSLLCSCLSSASHSPNPTRTHRQGNLSMQSMPTQPPGVENKVGGRSGKSSGKANRIFTPIPNEEKAKKTEPEYIIKTVVF